ncbi:ornithine cyclodeaminase family protein [Streptomyces aurantiacus]|uniref:Putative Ornithine cyclodeaminase n=1 Tax=Streptomyces aurantiacus JA 4570 TaxID=1286094 RepID=S3ZSK9_9ACTN|nr:ornithine cyclodeaminase family protein [Streptomyces aurantiacus]EPH45759.1 putative Ornithine cyclodeaminase [Streptomyces aurantiacus JA 4570]
MLRFDEYPNTELVYLSRQDVCLAAAEVDVVSVVRDAIVRHAEGRTILPDEAYLGWTTDDGFAARSLAMPGGIHTDHGLELGLKVINGSLGNPGKGVARSQGLMLLFDRELAWPRAVMEAAYVSAFRTAAVSAVSALALGVAPLRHLAILGCGTLARAHVQLLSGALGDLESLTLYDTAPERSRALADAVTADPDFAGLRAEVAASPEACVRDADLVIPATVTTEGYLRPEWFAPGTLIVHVSLDDVLPEVVDAAGLVVVDDWGLVSHDHRRLLGRMYREGSLRGPDGEYAEQAVRRPGARQVDGTLGEVLLGTCPGRKADADLVLCNPFGMSILDVALGGAVATAAERQGLGMRIPR